MGYVPPHLRNKGGSGGGGDGAGPGSSSSSAPPAGPPRSSSYGDLGGSRGSRGGGWGDERGGGSSGGFGGRRPEPARGGSGGGGGGRYSSGPIDPVFVEYSPSDRVKALNDEQIADIRQRLNVTVEVPEGEPPAAAPVESFRDMVRLLEQSWW